MIRCREAWPASSPRRGLPEAVVELDHHYPSAAACAEEAARRLDDREMGLEGWRVKDMGDRERLIEVSGFGRTPEAVHRFRVVTGLIRVYDAREEWDG